MRSRPSVQLYLRPGVAQAGSSVRVEAVLTSASDTPVSALTLTVRGLEHGVVPMGKTSQHEVHQHVARRATFPARTLEKGEHRISSRFDIPAEGPASFVGTYLSVVYEVEVHVAIPWWPDRHARFVIPVARPPSPRPPPMPRVFASSVRGPKGKDVYIECSLDDVRTEPGSVITGAVSFANVARARISHVQLELVSTEIVRFAYDGDEHRSEGRGFVAKILDRPPNEGESIPFRMRVPQESAPSFGGVLGRLEWRLAVIGHVSLGRDVRLEIPVEIRDPSPAGTASRTLATAPPVGRERRARVWAAAARELGLDSFVEREEMRTTFGAASVTLRLEHREEVGLHAVADLSWQPVAGEIEVRERRWTDAFGGKEVELDHGPFRERFHVAGDAELAVIVLDRDVRAGMLDCLEAQIDEEGASLSRAASVQSSEALAHDLAPLLSAARALGEAVARAPSKTAAPYR